MNDRPATHSTPQVILGALIIAVGVILILDRVNLLSAGDLFRFWPLLIVAYGLSRFAQPHGTHGRLFGGILVLFGGLLFLDVLDLVPFSVWDLWPLVFVIGGASLIWRASTRNAPPRPSDDTSDTLNAFAFMGGIERRISSKEFRGGEITAIMGGCEIDLRGSSIRGEAVLDVFAFWGGIDLQVPEEWSVSVIGTPILGGIEDTTRGPKGGGGQRLVVRGNVIMGGLDLKN